MKRGGQRRAAARLECFALAVVLTTSVVGAREAWSADAAEVETLIRQGVDLRRAGKDGQAITVFSQAFHLDRTPRTAGQLGLCELSLGYWFQGEAHLNEALASPSHPWVQRNRQTLQSALETARRNLGDVLVTAHPDRGEVVVDERHAGQLPLATPLRLSKGSHVIVIRLDGYQSGALPVAVAGGDHQSIEIAQRPVSAETPPIAVPVSLGGAQAEPATSSTPISSGPREGTGAQDPRPQVAEAPVSDLRRPMAWGAAGIGALALGFGVYNTTVWIGKAGEFRDHVGPLASNPALMGLNCGNDERDSGGPGCSAIHAALSRARTWAIVGYAAGAAFGGVAAYLFSTSPAQSRDRTALACAPDLATAGLTCVAAF